MSERIIAYLECGCAIGADGHRSLCPTCANPRPPEPIPTADDAWKERALAAEVNAANTQRHAQRNAHDWMDEVEALGQQTAMLGRMVASLALALDLRLLGPQELDGAVIGFVLHDRSTGTTLLIGPDDDAWARVRASRAKFAAVPGEPL